MAAALAAVLSYVLLIGKAVCWRIMLAPRHQSTLRLVRCDRRVCRFGARARAPREPPRVAAEEARRRAHRR